MSHLNHNLISRLNSNPATVSLPEAPDVRVIEAGLAALSSGAIASVLFHCKKAEAEEALGKEISHKGITWLADTHENLETETKIFLKDSLEKRGKPLDEKQLSQMASKPLYQAGYLLATDQTDCVVAGCVETTADVIRAGLRTTGLANGIKTVSGSFYLEKFEGSEDKSIMFADSGVVIEPTVEQLCDIAAATVETWERLYQNERNPKVAFLSFSTHGSASHPSADKMIEAHKLFQGKYPSICSDGELQFDAAFVPTIAAKKCPESPLGGEANIFIFPDLGAGNIAYKIAQRIGSYMAYGPLLQGFRGIYSDLSRGASASDIESSIYISAIRSQKG